MTRIVLRDDFSWTFAATEAVGAEGGGDDGGSAIVGEPLRFVGGMDISFVKDDPENACACLVVLSFPDLKVVYECSRMTKLSLPYISGFLAFRFADWVVIAR